MIILLPFPVLPLNNAVTALNPLYAVPCNFEDGLCPGYEIDKTSKAQWLLQQGPTFSSNTGPSYDKTYGRNGNGKTIFLDFFSEIFFTVRDTIWENVSVDPLFESYL